MWGYARLAARRRGFDVDDEMGGEPAAGDRGPRGRSDDPQLFALEQAWEWYAFFNEQRYVIFRFFIIIYGALVTGYSYAMSRSLSLVAVLAATLAVVVAALFMFLDWRIQRLVVRGLRAVREMQAILAARHELPALQFAPRGRVRWLLAPLPLLFFVALLLSAIGARAGLHSWRDHACGTLKHTAAAAGESSEEPIFDNSKDDNLCRVLSDVYAWRRPESAGLLRYLGKLF